jgi:glycosyltransferase involved in cell wall biosynthesis
MTKPLITLVLPAFHEESSIVECLTRLFVSMDSSRIPFIAILVVDGVDDNTAMMARGFGDPRLTIIELDKNYGKGRAIRTGLQDCTTEFVGYIDADLDLHPEGLVSALDQLIRAPRNVVGAIGSKLHPASKVEYPASRRTLSVIYQRLVRILFQLKVEDTQTGLKVFRTSAVNEVFPLLQADGFEFDLELLTRLAKKGGMFFSVPVDLDYQFSSSIGLRNSVKTITSTLKLAIRIRFSRP